MIYRVNWVLLPALPILLGYFYYGLRVAEALKQRHTNVWIDLGSFSLKNWGIANSWKTGNYILFKNKFKELKDCDLDDLVFRARLLGWLFLALIVLNLYLDSTGHSVVLTNASS